MFICITNVIIILKNKKIDFFYFFLKRVLFFIFVHAFHIFICECFFSDIPYLDTAAPYGLVYGPLLYIAVSGLKNKGIKSIAWKIHFIPFLVFYIVYLLLVFDANLRTHFLLYFLRILYVIIPISFIAYIIAMAFQRRNLNYSESLKMRHFFLTMAMLLFFVGIFFFVARFTGERDLYSDRLVIYCAMLLAVINILLFQLQNNRRKRDLIFKKELVYELSASSDMPKYTKSKITEEQLNEYEEKLYRIMDEEKLFLDIDLSLDKLAKHLKIPKYHLTQLFSLRVDKNFNQFVNFYRINYACAMLDEMKDVKIEVLIYECGFNSKSTFNRRFKAITGVTPSEYFNNKRVR